MKVVPTSFRSETHPLLGRKDLGVELDKRVGAVGASKGGKLIDVQVLFGAYYKTRPNCRPDGVSGQKLIRDPSKLATRWEISSKIN